MRTPKTFLSKSALLGLAALGVGGAIVMSPTAAHAADGAAPAAASKVASYDPALQPNGYYCGPAATRVALTAHWASPPSFDELAGKLGTTTSGTNSINDVTRVLNEYTGGGKYQSVEIPGTKATPEQTEKLRTDVVAAINSGEPSRGQHRRHRSPTPPARAHSLQGRALPDHHRLHRGRPPGLHRRLMGQEGQQRIPAPRRNHGQLDRHPRLHLLTPAN